MGYKEVHVRWIEFDFRCCGVTGSEQGDLIIDHLKLKLQDYLGLDDSSKKNIFYSGIAHCHAMWPPCVPKKYQVVTWLVRFLLDGFPMISPLSAEADGGAHGQVAGSSLSSSLHGLRRTATFSFHHFSTAF